ncbi:MAG: polysulfide reductase NrfD [Anaerolineales bacterium]|nr:polysulfide reductase NrfD [Anaerolineales bacterium]
MKHKETTWGWMLAVDFFFAGMGGAMIALAGISYLFFGDALTATIGNFIGPIFVAMGAGFLVLELGRPLQAWRVFMNPKAILTFGAWNMTLAIGFGFVFASFRIASLPWAGWVWAQQITAVSSIITGLIVATYPGVLLGRHNARPFWTGPGIVSLFLLSSLLTGLAAHDLANSLFTNTTNFSKLLAGLLVLQVVLWGLYIYMKCTGTTNREATIAQQWVNGDFAVGFWAILLGLGSLVPLIIYLLPSNPIMTLAGILVLLGGAWMRWMVVKSGEYRTWLPGEEFYLSRLPRGDEEFLKALK